MLIGVALLGSASASFAATQTLKLYFVHTGEKASITFKRNGIYDPRGLAQVNRFLRDWRKNEPAKMDPELLDLIWEVHKRSGSRDYIHIVSGYRSPDTNNMLRSRSANTGVAKRSQHTLGKAMDFYIPGVNLSTLRAIGMQMQIGGVGFYPTSGSPFVHMDVGNVRAWPRMSRQELAKIFPDGRTLHRPADGRPLPGYNQALAAARQKPDTGVANPGADDDSDVVSPGSDSNLLTAMLPVPKTRAQAMFDNQLGRGNPLDDDLALQMVPLPTLRPPQIKVAAVEVGNRGRPTAGVEKSVQRVPRVFFTEPLTSIASLPMHGAVARSAQRFRGHGAFATQSIRPSAQATTSSLATFERRPQEEAAITGTIAPRAGSAEFDAGRFSSEG